MQQASCLEGGPLLWIWPLYLHINQKSDDDDYANFTGMPLTFNGMDSSLTLQLDTSEVPIGDSGSFKFRSRDQTATLLLIQFYPVDTKEPVASLEFSLFSKNLQVTAKSNAGNCSSYSLC